MNTRPIFAYLCRWNQGAASNLPPRMKIKELAADERPREKMLAKGAAALSNAELIAILLRSGTVRRNAVDTARVLLSAAGGTLASLSALSLERLCAEEGIGPGKAATLLAALELGRRFFQEAAAGPRRAITAPEMVYRLMLPLLKGLDHEECWILYLNRSHYVLSQEKLFDGGLCETVMDAQVVVRRALERRASGVILIHNHPSGNPRPGSADVRATRGLKQALGALGLSLYDHIVVSDDCFFSFAENRVGK